MSAASGTDNSGLGFRLRFALAASELLIVTPILTAIQADPYGPMTLSPMAAGMRIGERCRERRRSARGRPWDVPCVSMSLCSSLIILFHLPGARSTTLRLGHETISCPQAVFAKKAPQFSQVGRIFLTPQSSCHMSDLTCRRLAAHCRPRPLGVGATDRPPQQLANDVAGDAGVREGVRGTFPASQCHCVVH
jgi:hypothetical protein